MLQASLLPCAQDAAKKALEALKLEPVPGACRIELAAAAVILQAYDELGRRVPLTQCSCRMIQIVWGNSRHFFVRLRLPIILRLVFLGSCCRWKELRSIFQEAFGSLSAAPIDAVELWCATFHPGRPVSCF